MPSRVITFKADDELVEKIDKLAKMLGETRSNIIRKAVIRYIRDNGFIDSERGEDIIEAVVL